MRAGDAPAAWGIPDAAPRRRSYGGGMIGDGPSTIAPPRRDHRFAAFAVLAALSPVPLLVWWYDPGVPSSLALTGVIASLMAHLAAGYGRRWWAGVLPVLAFGESALVAGFLAASGRGRAGDDFLPSSASVAVLLGMYAFVVGIVAVVVGLVVRAIVDHWSSRVRGPQSW
jgi:hypothetical protein